MTTLRPDDFCAVVLAGGSGARLYPFTETYPKCLLNIGNYPLIYYTLKALETAGFDETIIVVREHWAIKVRDTIDLLKMKIRTCYHTISHFHPNTATVLNNLKDTLKCDNIFVLSGDTYGDISLRSLAATYRKNDASLTVYIQPPFPDDVDIDSPKKKGTGFNYANSNGPYSSAISEDFIAVCKTDNRLLFCQNERDVEDELDFSRAMLLKYPRFRIYKNHHDLHIYIIKKHLLDFIAKKSLLNFKADVLSYLLDHQFSAKNVPEPPPVQEDEFATQTPIHRESFFTEEQIDLTPIRCYAHIAPESSRALRVDSISSFFAANVLSLKEINTTDPKPLSLLNITENKDFMIGIGSSVDSSATLRRCIIGRNCTVGPRSKIINSVILNDVNIESDCEIANCIIGNGAKVNTKSIIAECLIGINEIIPHSVFEKEKKNG